MNNSREQCYFVLDDSTRCQERAVFEGRYCRKHVDFLKSQTNRDIIKQLSLTVRKCICLTADRKISPAPDGRIWTLQFKNLFNELTGRGYKYEEVMRSVKAEQDEHGVLDDILKGLGQNLKWRRFEKIVGAIQELTMGGADVKFDDHIPGARTGSMRQVDISVRFQQGAYKFLLAIECKDYNGRVPIDDLESFRTKLEDIGAQKGIMVSSAGFQKGAEATAKAYNIDLFTLQEEKTDWKKITREISISIPFPETVEFEYAESGGFPKIKIGDRCSWNDVFIFKNDLEKPESLGQVCVDLCSWVYSQKISLPAKADFEFSEKRLLKVPSVQEPMPIQGLRILFVSYTHKERKDVDVPPEIINYRYEDALNGTQHAISADIVQSKLKQT